MNFFNTFFNNLKAMKDEMEAKVNTINTLTLNLEREKEITAQMKSDKEAIIQNTKLLEISIDEKTATISNLTNEIVFLNNKVKELDKPSVNALNQFKTGDIELTYTRLNGKVQTFMIDKNEQLAKNFKVSEFLCPNTNELILSELVVSIAQNVRDKYKKSITITSGYRTQKFNDSLVGSVKTSPHIKGKAIDFKVSGINKNTVLAYVKTIPNVRYAYTNNTNMKYAVHLNI